MPFHDSPTIPYSSTILMPIQSILKWLKAQQSHFFVALNRWTNLVEKFAKSNASKKVCGIGKPCRDISAILSHQCYTRLLFFLWTSFAFVWLAGWLEPLFESSQSTNQRLRFRGKTTVWMADWSGATNCTIKNNRHTI